MRRKASSGRGGKEEEERQSLEQGKRKEKRGRCNQIMQPCVIELFGLWKKKENGQDEKTKKKKSVCLIGPIVFGKATSKAGF